MFTRYKGIDVPQNYSGNRFKSEIIPPITETKTHKPTNFTPTKTSISPAFESALRTSQNMYQEEKIFDSVSDFEEDDYETNTENEKRNSYRKSRFGQAQGQGGALWSDRGFVGK